MIIVYNNFNLSYDYDFSHRVRFLPLYNHRYTRIGKTLEGSKSIGQRKGRFCVRLRKNTCANAPTVGRGGNFGIHIYKGPELRWNITYKFWRQLETSSGARRVRVPRKTSCKLDKNTSFKVRITSLSIKTLDLKWS